MKFPKDWHLRTPALRELGLSIRRPEAVRMDPYNQRVRETQEETRLAQFEHDHPELARFNREINAKMAALGIK